MTSSQESATVLEVKDLSVHFPTSDGIVKAVDGLSFSLDRGKTLGIVGESGSGKSVSSSAILGLHHRQARQGPRGDLAQRRRPPHGQRGGDAQAPRPRGRDDLPGPAVRDAPVLHGRQPDHRGLPGAQRRLQEGRARPRHRDARPGRDPAAGPPHRRLPAPVLRRHAPARDDRDGPDQRPGAADRRRADHRPRRDRAGADPGPAPGPAARVQLRDHDHHPRPRGGGRDGRRRAGHVRRPRGRVRAVQGDPDPPGDALHVGSALQRPRREGGHPTPG